MLYYMHKSKLMLSKMFKEKISIVEEKVKKENLRTDCN